MDPFSIFAGVSALATGIASLWNSKRNLDRQESTNQQLIDLENTAVQRRKEDLIKAGFNPVLAAGSAAGTPSLSAPQFDNDFSMVNNAIGAMNQVSQMNQTKQQVKLLKQQEQSVANSNALFDIDKQIKEEQLRGAQALTRERQVSAQEKEYNLGLYQKSGMPTNASMPGKMVNEASNAAFRAGKAIAETARNVGQNAKSGFERVQNWAKEASKNDVEKIKQVGGKVKNFFKNLTTTPEEAYNKSRR